MESSVWRPNGSLSIRYAESLAAARAEFGWTRQLHTSIKVRRATAADMEGVS